MSGVIIITVITVVVIIMIIALIEIVIIVVIVRLTALKGRWLLSISYALPCPKHNPVPFSRAYGHQSIHSRNK